MKNFILDSDQFGTKVQASEPTGKSKSEIRKDIFVGNAYPYAFRMKEEEYNKLKFLLQVELVKFQDHVKKNGDRYIIIFEGRDAAGKGSSIKRFTENLDPRRARVVALEKPNKKEKGQWYFQRYINHFPTEGEIVFFDRSWYNRAGVEKVMNFANKKEYDSFVSQVSPFEKLIVDDGIKLIKFYFSVGLQEQKQRFYKRENHPLKQWKLSPLDKVSQNKWEEYTEAKRMMFYHSHKNYSPWIIAKSDDKMRARLNAIRYLLSISKYKNKSSSKQMKIDPLVIASASEVYDIKK